MNPQTLAVGALIFVGSCVVAVTIWMIFRDIATHTFNTGRAIDHIWAEFAPVVGKGWDAIVKLDNQQTGEFTFKGRKYIVGAERWQKDYPPGRSKLAQVTFYKCLADPASSDMLTNISGKPTVNAVLVNAIAEQKDTTTAMQRSADEAGGGSMAKKFTWLYIGLGVIGVIGVAGIIFNVKGMGISESILSTLKQIAGSFGVQ